MKKVVVGVLPVLFLVSTWIGCQQSEACDPPPCVQPNINNLISLHLYFENLDLGNQIGLVRIDNSRKSVIDTLLFTLQEDKTITIGFGGQFVNREILGFTMNEGEHIIESATLDFDILLMIEKIHSISTIEIMKRVEDCQ